MLKDSKKINYQIKKDELIEEINFLRKYSNKGSENTNGQKTCK